METLNTRLCPKGLKWTVRFFDIVLESASNTVRFETDYNDKGEYVGARLVNLVSNEVLSEVTISPTTRWGIFLGAQRILMTQYLDPKQCATVDNHKLFEEISNITPSCVIRSRLSYTNGHEPTP